jgi:Fungal Zn(2)-Cys(6) binuclear cluster domain
VRPANCAESKSARPATASTNLQCDEATPSCANCLRRHLQCQYRSSQSTGIPTHRLENAISPGSVPTAGFQVTDDPQHSLFNLRDMEIFHFYVTRSYLTLHFENKIDHSLWHDHVPGVAFRVCDSYLSVLMARILSSCTRSFAIQLRI